MFAGRLERDTRVRFWPAGLLDTGITRDGSILDSPQLRTLVRFFVLLVHQLAGPRLDFLRQVREASVPDVPGECENLYV